jgi:ADP-ribose pyrophosphatase
MKAADRSPSPDPARGVAPRRVYAGRIIDVHLESVALPGGVTTELEIIRHPGAAAVVPLLEDGRVVLLRQYRHAAGGFILEIPAGKLDPGESPEDCARRETEEEAGMRPGALHSLGMIFTTPGFTDEKIHLFAATELEPSTQNLDADEVLEVLPMPLEAALELTREDRIQDSKTLCALLRLDQEIRAGRFPRR